MVNAQFRLFVANPHRICVKNGFFEHREWEPPMSMKALFRGAAQLQPQRIQPDQSTLWFSRCSCLDVPMSMNAHELKLTSESTRSIDLLAFPFWVWLHCSWQVVCFVASVHLSVRGQTKRSYIFCQPIPRVVKLQAILASEPGRPAPSVNNKTAGRDGG